MDQALREMDGQHHSLVFSGCHIVPLPRFLSIPGCTHVHTHATVRGFAACAGGCRDLEVPKPAQDKPLLSPPRRQCNTRCAHSPSAGAVPSTRVRRQLVVVAQPLLPASTGEGVRLLAGTWACIVVGRESETWPCGGCVHRLTAARVAVVVALGVLTAWFAA